MKSQWTRYTLVALFACLLGALAHASISRAVLDRGTDRTAARPAAQQAAAQPAEGELQNTLLRKLWDLIDRAQDLSSDEKSEAFEILEEADPILTRIKKENERAIEILRNPPRMRVPEPPAPDQPDAEEAEEAPEAEES